MKTAYTDNLFTLRELATLHAAIVYWDERNLPEDKKKPSGDLEEIAACGGQYPALDTEEIHKLKSALTVLAISVHETRSP